MKRAIFKIVVTAMVLAGLASCNKWLDVTPKDSVPAKDLFSTGYGFRNALNGVYLALSEQSLYGRDMKWGFVSAISQQYIQNRDIYSMTADRLIDASNLEYETEETTKYIEDIWEKSYTAIANLNIMLSYLDKADPDIFAYGEDEMGLIRGEALGLRAMIHFDLLRLFAPAPSSNPSGMYLVYRDSYSPSVGEKLTVDAFLAKVTGDLEQAYDYLKVADLEFNPGAMWNSGSAGSETPAFNSRIRFKPSRDEINNNKGRFFSVRGVRLNYMALLGIMARVYMYAEDYVNAYACANELYTDFYVTKGWIGFNTPESISASFSNRYAKMADDILFGVYREQLYQEFGERGGDSEKATLPLANIAELFASDNTVLYKDYRLEYLMLTTNDTHEYKFSIKYYHASYPEEMLNDENKIVPMIRFSEVVHILAELACREGNISGGISYLEEVRRARGADRSLSSTVTTPEQLMDEIITDARKEFIAEGETFFLYKRLNMPTVKSANTGQNIDMLGKYVLPIPNSETTF